MVTNEWLFCGICPGKETLTEVQYLNLLVWFWWHLTDYTLQKDSLSQLSVPNIFIYLEIGSHCVAQVTLELLIHLPLSTRCLY